MGRMGGLGAMGVMGWVKLSQVMEPEEDGTGRGTGVVGNRRFKR